MGNHTSSLVQVGMGLMTNFYYCPIVIDDYPSVQYIMIEVSILLANAISLSMVRKYDGFIDEFRHISWVCDGWVSKNL